MLDGQMRAWNREYRMRGKLWRGEQRDRGSIEQYLQGNLILDDGSGDGKSTPRSWGVVSLDFSLHALLLNPSDMKILGEMSRLPFKDSSFSSVLFIHSLDHLLVSERASALDEARRVLVPEGFTIVRVFSRRDFRFGKGREVEDGTFLRGNGVLTHYFTEGEIVSPRGMKEVKREEINYYINIHGRAYLRQEYIIIFKKLKSEYS
ncbi:MAG: methyltransferase domain-containing protein [Thermoplasmatales archaeon]